MFYDTIDFFTDDKKTLEKKKHRRRSNYYERKSATVQGNIEDITKKLDIVKDKSVIKDTAFIGSSSQVMKYPYKSYKKEMLSAINETISTFESSLTSLKKSKEDISSRYKYHKSRG